MKILLPLLLLFIGAHLFMFASTHSIRTSLLLLCRMLLNNSNRLTEAQVCGRDG